MASWLLGFLGCGSGQFLGGSGRASFRSRLANRSVVVQAGQASKPFHSSPGSWLACLLGRLEFVRPSRASLPRSAGCSFYYTGRGIRLWLREFNPWLTDWARLSGVLIMHYYKQPRLLASSPPFRCFPFCLLGVSLLSHSSHLATWHLSGHTESKPPRLSFTSPLTTVEVPCPGRRDYVCAGRNGMGCLVAGWIAGELIPSSGEITLRQG